MMPAPASFETFRGPRHGHCLDVCLWIVAHERGLSLVLGQLARPGALLPCRHAWVSRADGWVFCTANASWWLEARYIDVYGATVDREYTRDEVLKMAKHFRGRFVTWDGVLQWEN